MKHNLNDILSHITYSGTLTPEHIEIFETIPSTHDYLKNKLKNNAKNSIAHTISSPFDFCLAEYQSAGHGRFDRKWISPAESNIYLSCRWKNNNIQNINGLSLVVGLSVTAALKSTGLQNLTIKWPNDILWQDKKLGGILIDIIPHALIISIGLNVNMPEVDMENMTRPWTSLEKITGNTQNRNKIAGLLINYLLYYLDLFEKNNFNYFMSEWKKQDYLLNKEINLSLDPKEIHKITGIARGINSDGCLLLEDESGKIKPYAAGEASISI